LHKTFQKTDFMKYLVRCLKHLLYFVLLFFVCILVVRLTMHAGNASLAEMFKEGSFAKIAIIFVFFAAIYPLVGYKSGKMTLDGEWKDYHDVVVETMKNAQYSLVSDEDGVMKFRSDRLAMRITRMWEDAITFTPAADGIHVVVDGRFGDTSRLIGAIYYNYRMQNPQTQE